MIQQASIPVSEAPRSEATSKKAVHKYICYLITMLGLLLQLQQGTASLFDKDYPDIVILIVALIIYIGSLIGTTQILQSYPNSDLVELNDKISLLSGALALIMELMILVPELGLAALFVWIVWFLSLVAEYACLYGPTLYKSAVDAVVHAFGKLKEHLSMIIVHFQ